MSDPELHFDPEMLFDVDRRPEVEIRCKGCGGYILALFRIDGQDIVVTDAEDIPHRISGRPTPRLAPRVKSFRHPMFYDPGRVLWPLVVRCREHGATHVSRAQLDEARAEHRRTGSIVRLKVQPPPSASM